MIPEWVLTSIGSSVGAFIAALFGAYVGFRRSRKERALDRRVGWHESSIQSLAQYEEKLERLDNYFKNVLIVQRRKERGVGVEKEALPMKVKVPAELWKELGEAESRARAALRVGDIYAEERAQVQCSGALSSTGSVNVVSGQWWDISAEPEIVWAELAQKARGCAELRGSLQESLKVVLELDGIVARILGPKYRKWRRIAFLKREMAKNARKMEAIRKRAE